MKLCDRCRVPGCCLNYLGPACAHSREEVCPDVQPNNAEIISNMSIEEMAENLLPMFEELCEDGVPSKEFMMHWLTSPYEEVQM